MLGDSSAAVLGGGGVGGGGGSGGGNSSDAVAPTVVAAATAGTSSSHDGGESTAAAAVAAGSNSGEEDVKGRGEEGDRSFGGNRWPRQETLALLKMRSDMDVVFRDASVKGPLWEDVSRKMAELGYHRSAKKCKEKFENLYKYHKRTKDGRTGKSEGKTYRFFDQLEALDHQNHPPPPPTLKIQSSQQPSPQAPPPSSSLSSQLLAIPATPVSVVVTTTPFSSSTNVINPPPHHHHLSTVPSTITPQPNVLTPPINLTSSTIHNPPPSYNIFPQPPPPSTLTAKPTQSSFPTELLSNSPSSSTSSDESIERRQRRKRKWKDFFGRLTKEVIEKQEQMQKRLLEALEKREHERMVSEEAWRMQEMARINREREILAQERSIAAAKDAAVMALLQKIAEQQNLGLPLNNINISPPPPPPPPQTAQPTAQPAPAPAPAPPLAQATSVTNLEMIVATDNNNNHNGENLMTPSSSRWPKVEVQALIKLRTSMDEKYQENGPKGPLWEEISAAMRKLGYNRNAKRCKEKWENINKYFKKVKESNKKRPEDSKTCPYFHQLDALYREKNKLEIINTPPAPSTSSATTANPADNNSTMPPTSGPPLMVQPEQQWPPQQDTSKEKNNNNNNAELEEEEEEEEEDDMDEDKDIDDEDDDEEEEEEGSGNYEIVASKPASVSAAE